MAATRQHDFASLMARLSRAGFKKEFARAAILPDWWGPDCERDAGVLPEIELRVARFVEAPLEVVRDPRASLRPPTRLQAQLRRPRNVKRGRIEPAIHAAIAIAGAVARSVKTSRPFATPPQDPAAWHRQLAAERPVTLSEICSDLWNRGIPVVPIARLPAPKFQGAACIVEGRPVVLIGHKNDEPARVAFWVAHEVGHIVAGDCEPDAPVIDEDEVRDRSEIERRADNYARATLLGTRGEPDLRSNDFLTLAKQAAEFERATGAEAGAVLFSWAARSDRYMDATMAAKALYRATGARKVLRDAFDTHVDVEHASETDRELLRCVESGSAPLAAAD